MEQPLFFNGGFGGDFPHYFFGNFHPYQGNPPTSTRSTHTRTQLQPTPWEPRALVALSQCHWRRYLEDPTEVSPPGPVQRRKHHGGGCMAFRWIFCSFHRKGGDFCCWWFFVLADFLGLKLRKKDLGFYLMMLIWLIRIFKNKRININLI